MTSARTGEEESFGCLVGVTRGGLRSKVGSDEVSKEQRERKT